MQNKKKQLFEHLSQTTNGKKVVLERYILLGEFYSSLFVSYQECLNCGLPYKKC